VLFDDDIAGSNYYEWGDNKVKYILVRIDTVGWETRRVSHVDTDRILRAGFVSLGFHGDAGDGTERWYWREPIWIDFENFEWSPPSNNFDAEAYTYARGIRWGLSEDVTGHMWVGGV
jgi:hypothetical protein